MREDITNIDAPRAQVEDMHQKGKFYQKFVSLCLSQGNKHLSENSLTILKKNKRNCHFLSPSSHNELIPIAWIMLFWHTDQKYTMAPGVRGNCQQKPLWVNFSQS